MARRRYGWEKRVKEIARKQKHEEKLKRRQGKASTPTLEEAPEVVGDVTENPIDSFVPEIDLRQVYPDRTDTEKI